MTRDAILRELYNMAHTKRAPHISQTARQLLSKLDSRVPNFDRAFIQAYALGLEDGVFATAKRAIQNHNQIKDLADRVQ